MRKVTASRGFEWYPEIDPETGRAVPVRQKVLEGQTIEVTDEQAQLLAEHGHIPPLNAPVAALPSPADDRSTDL